MSRSLNFHKGLYQPSNEEKLLIKSILDQEAEELKEAKFKKDRIDIDVLS
jgi:hypothetical protein